MEKTTREKTTRTTRQEQKERTRTGLILQAESLFAERGISQTTTAEVAQALQVSHGTVFLHFPTRDDLVLAVVEKFGERLSAKLNETFSEKMRLREMLKAHVSVLMEFENFYLRLISESQSLPPQIRSILYAMNASLSYRFYRAAKDQMKDGSFKKMEQAPFFNTWLSLLHYHIQNRDLFSEKKPVLREIGDDLIRQFLNLVKSSS